MSADGGTKRPQIKKEGLRRMRAGVLAAALMLQALSLEMADAKGLDQPVLAPPLTSGSLPIVDVRFDAPYGQVLPSRGDEWAPTWGRDDVLYTGNNDGSNFGGVPSNTIAFGKLIGDDPYNLKGVAINGMEAFKERYLGPEAALWKSVDSYSVGQVFYRIVPCRAHETRANCLVSSDDGKRWTSGKPVFAGAKFDQARFIIWSKQSEVGFAANPKEYVYAASYAGVIEGEDKYFIGRASIARLSKLSAEDWSFLKKDFTWGALAEAAPLSSSGWLGPDRANWKTMNSYSVDGVLYMFVTRCTYPSASSDTQRRHTWRNSSVIKSTDNGLSWTRSPGENYASPMFPGQRFATAYFVWYGKDGQASADNADRYVYAVSNDGYFENGSDYVLGRVLREKLGNLSAADWSFYVKGDGMQDASWASSLDEAQSILSQPGRSSMTGMTYIPHLRRYVMVSWHYNQANFDAGIAAKDLSTVIEFFEAAKPWGPWTKVKSFETGKLGWFVPIVGQRFQRSSGVGSVQAFLYPAGFSTKPEGGVDFGLYKFNYVPITLSTTPLTHKDPEYVGGRSPK